MDEIKEGDSEWAQTPLRRNIQTYLIIFMVCLCQSIPLLAWSTIWKFKFIFLHLLCCVSSFRTSYNLNDLHRVFLNLKSMDILSTLLSGMPEGLQQSTGIQKNSLLTSGKFENKSSHYGQCWAKFLSPTGNFPAACDLNRNLKILTGNFISVKLRMLTSRIRLSASTILIMNWATLLCGKIKVLDKI